jgi:hypothetical protein
MIGNRRDVAVDVRIEMLAALALIDAAGNHMPEMRDDAGADQQLSLGVVVYAPRVAETVSDDFESVLRRVITPHAAVDLDAVAVEKIGRKRLACGVEVSLARRPPDF